MSHTVAHLTLGTANLGNLSRAMSDADAWAVLEAAWECGIRSFDTAPHYGLGLAERRLGAYLRTHDRTEWTISTKVGRLLRPNPDHQEGDLDDADGFVVPSTLHRVWDGSAAGVRTSAAESMERLGTDRFDVLYLHDPERYGPMAETTDEGLAALAALRDEGLVDRVGVGSMSTATLAHAAAHPATDEIMLAGRHTLVDPDGVRTILPLCRTNDVRVVPASVYASGLLARPVPHGNYEYSPAPTELVERAQRIADVCTAHGTDLPTAALHFVALDPSVTSVCLGASSPDQVRQSVERWLTPVDPALWEALVADGLIDAEAVAR